MRSVLISIRPKWCELIASGKKTVEVRKTKPKLETPFKVYIYCTSSNIHECLMQNESGVKLIGACNYKTAIPCGGHIANGKVIGEFTCRNINEYRPIQAHSGAIYWLDDKDFERTGFECLDDMCEYGNGANLYGWEISDLVIYDQPLELSEFIVPSKVGCCNEGKCRGCKWFDRGNGFNVEDDCNAPFNTDEYKPLRKAPQSWCHVEEVNR